MSLLHRSLESRAKASAATRLLIDREAAAGNENTLWETISSHMRSTAYRYTQSDNIIELYEWDIHDIWYELIQAAKNIDADHPGQDRLTRIVMWAKELGVLTRMRKRPHLTHLQRGNGEEMYEGKSDAEEVDEDEMVVQEAITSDGRIWVDLPFLVEDMRSAWNDAMDPSTSAAHRRNLAATIARLAGVGVCNDTLSECGFQLLRQTLETPRRLNAAAPESEIEVTGVDASIIQSSLTIMELLPAVNAWFLYAGHKLLRLSRKPYEGFACGSEALIPGELARSAGINARGFSVARCHFWKKRLEELSQCDQDDLKREAFRGLNIINMTLKEIEEPGIVRVVC